MATVVITFFLLASLYVCKMDADYQDRRRVHTTSRREKRWSMYSQRLEEIVSELMKPISDIRRSFDMDLSALLEEYLTEAGLHALNASEEGDAHCAPVTPNFAELALVLQQSATLYGRKVDFLYQHVLNVSESLHNNTQETEATSEQTENTVRRRRRQSSAPAVDFMEIELEPSGASRRRTEQPRPPPTLPRTYIELEPRVLADTDLQLYDYAGEPIGLPADFYATRRLQGGLLVDELEGKGAQEEIALQPICLAELQAAIEAGTPSSTGPIESPGDELISPVRASTPLGHESPGEEPPQDGPPPPDLPPVIKRDRKRRSNTDMNGCFTEFIDEKVRRELCQMNSREFSINQEWVERVVSQRKRRIVAQRKKLRARAAQTQGHDFQGFDSSLVDIGGFTGWSRTESDAAAAALEAVTPAMTAAVTARSSTNTRLEFDSEDDGFFEKSSLGDSDDTHLNHSINITNSSGICSSWQEGVAARALAAEARGGIDVETLARTVLDACAPPTPSADTGTETAEQCTPFTQVLRVAATEVTDVSRLFLTTLFLANTGNVEIVQGPALSVNEFSLRVVSRDHRRYHAAAAAAVAATVVAATPR